MQHIPLVTSGNRYCRAAAVRQLTCKGFQDANAYCRKRNNARLTLPCNPKAGGEKQLSMPTSRTVPTCRDNPCLPERVHADARPPAYFQLNFGEVCDKVSVMNNSNNAAQCSKPTAQYACSSPRPPAALRRCGDADQLQRAD
jgi:hypothetical protein